MTWSLGRTRPLTITVLAMFFLSGAASLALQVVWFKQLEFVLGASVFAVSVTVAAFFLGLSLGGWIGGRIADRATRLLRTYGMLEGSLSILAAVTTAILASWEVWIGALAHALAVDSPVRTPLIVVIAFAILLPPTTLMGATLPVLARWVVRRRDRLAVGVGVLYGVNTFGAAAGTFVVGTAVIPGFGVHAAAGGASAVYATIGLGAIALSRGEAPIVLAPEPVAAVTEPEARLRMAVYAISGFIAIAYEVVWFRLLYSEGNASVFAFSGMLSTYLLGLVLGAWACARWLAPHKDRLLRSFAVLQFGIAVAGVWTLAALGRSANLVVASRSVAAAVLPAGLSSWLGGDPGFFALCFAVLIVPTTLLGIGFPLASELVVARLHGLGSRLGTLYAANTAGGVLGSLCAGFVMLPLLGSEGSIALLVALGFGLFVVLLVASPELHGDRVLLRQGAIAAGMVAAAFLVIGPTWLRDAQTRSIGAKLLAFREAAEATYVVYSYHDTAGRYAQVVVNGHSYANNRLPGRRYMAFLAHLPVLVDPAPTRALVICIGTGTTAGALTTWPDLRHIDAVDLSPHIFSFAPFFVPINHNFLHDPRVREVVADGRHFLLSTTHHYDVITMEPPPPTEVGIVQLYSEEFYALAHQRLVKGGVLAQWDPLDMSSRGDLARMVVRAVMAKFAHVSLWVPSRREGILVASDRPLQLDPAVLARRMAEPGAKQDLHAVGVDNVEDLLATFVAADDDLRAWVGDAPTVTDDRPRLEYYNLAGGKPITGADVLALRHPVERYLTGPVDEVALDRARKVVDAIWAENDAHSKGDLVGARRAVDEVAGLEPDNVYMRYLAAELGEVAPQSAGR